MKNKNCSIIALLAASALAVTSLFTVGMSASSGLVDVQFTEFPDDEPSGSASGGQTATAEPVKLAAPLIWSFESEAECRKLVTFKDFEGDSEGAWEFTTVDGVGALRLKYLPYKSYGNYRTMPQNIMKDSLPATHKYMCITFMTTDSAAATVTLLNNKGMARTVLCDNAAAYSGGKWVTTKPVDISAQGQFDRYLSGMHCGIEYNSLIETSEFYIKEIGFFGSEAQAHEYYGDTYNENADKAYDVMTFGPGCNGVVVSGENYGNAVINDDTGTVDIKYASSTNHKVNYMAKLKFKTVGDTSADKTYIRVLYSAKNPEGVTNASMFLRNDKTYLETIRLVENIPDTNGEFVLSDTARISQNMAERFSGSVSYTATMHCSFNVNTMAQGGEYKIKAIYFFKTRAEADAFSASSAYTKLDIVGNDISTYKIVIPSASEERISVIAQTLRNQIAVLSGVKLDIVTDAAPEAANEILLGNTNRSASKQYPAGVSPTGEKAYRTFWLSVIGSKLVVNCVEEPTLSDAVDLLLRSYLYLDAKNAPETVSLTEKINNVGSSTLLTPSDYNKYFGLRENVTDPTVYAEDFDTDDGYYTEENGASDFKIANGVISTKTDDFALTYIHVYEPNIRYKATLTFKNAGKNGEFGIMGRYCSPEAFVRGGYDFASGTWYIESREGWDFALKRASEVKATVNAGQAYDVELLVEKDYASLYVDGKAVIEKAAVSHLSPGRVAIYAEDIELTADNTELTLLSGEGTILRYVEHTKLPEDYFMEGGGAVELKDGTLSFFSHYNKGITYKSLDNGNTWTKSDNWMDCSTYHDVIRLNNGDLMKFEKNSEIYYCSTSSDDGKTWVRRGTICSVPFKNTTSYAINMNDKGMQSPTTDRIFYGVNYMHRSDLVDGRRVFGEFYYSDDNGATWKKAETDSWEIKGNEKAVHFGESKMLECADGSIRVYNSWNDYGCIVYSESFDNGVTWGPIQKLEDLPCTRSSMQFARDPYADNDHTYYMVWPNDEAITPDAIMPRSRLSLAYSPDGKEWTVLGDIWCWESNYCYGNAAFINHIVDPFITVAEDVIICGSGFSEHAEKLDQTAHNTHQGQRQHIYTIRKDTLVIPESLGSFTDVSTKDSYYAAVKFVTEKGLFNGTSETTFSPATTMTRSMFVTVLGRLDGADVSKYTAPTFSDVVAGQWYTSYVEWAAANGVVNGIGGGLYGINDNVTVEQVCVMLSRYNGAKSAAASGKTLADFTDSASVSSWAHDAVKWAVENGVYAGAAGKLNPTSPASRALVATMFYNYVSVFAK